MEMVLADLSFGVATVIAAVHKAWAIAAAAFGLFLVYIDSAIKGF